MVMEIAILHPAFFEGNNGAERFAYEMGKHLKADIYTVRFTSKMDEFYPGISNMVHPLKMRFPDSFSIYPWEYYARSALRRDVKGDFLLIMSNFCMYRHSFDKRPYLYLCHTPERGFYDLKKPLMDRINTWPFVSRTMAKTSMAIRGKLDHYYFSKVVDPNRVVTNSQLVAQRYERIYGKKPRGVVYAPIDTTRFNNKDSEGFFFTAGGLRQNKRVDWQIKAIAKTGEKLVVAGDGPERKKLEKLAKKTGAKVEFLGRVGDDELVDLYSRCRAFVFTAEREDFGMAPIEALASGKPVLSVAEGGPLEYLNDKNSFMFSDVKGLNKAIRKADEDVCNQMKKACRRSSKRYDSAQVAKRILKHIKALMK